MSSLYLVWDVVQIDPWISILLLIFRVFSVSVNRYRYVLWAFVPWPQNEPRFLPSASCSVYPGSEVFGPGIDRTLYMIESPFLMLWILSLVQNEGLLSSKHDASIVSATVTVCVLLFHGFLLAWFVDKSTLAVISFLKDMVTRKEHLFDNR